MPRRTPAPTVERVNSTGREREMETYVILRRGGWESAEELREAAARSAAEDERMAEEVAWIRSYVLAERDGRAGTVCVYRATSPEAIRRHASAADLPVDEIVAVADTVVIRPDEVPVAMEGRERR
jgi:sporulation protein YlmC with PRC-barrel domain